MTIAPFNDSLVANDFPIPEEAPVITHTFPERFKKVGLIFY